MASHASLDFEQALRQGNRKQLLRLLETGDVQFFDDRGERIDPFLVAIKNQQWAMALDLMESNENPRYMLPVVPTDVDFEQLQQEREAHLERGETVPEVENPNPLVRDTPLKHALGIFLDALDTHRATKPLMAKLVARLDALATKAWAGSSPINATLAIAYDSPSWFEPSLARDVSPNAWVMHGATGATLTRLELAAMRGQTERVERLLEQGADPNWLSHCDRNAAHAAAEFPRYALRTKGNLCPSAMLARVECLKRLESFPGVSEQRDFHGNTPRQLLEKSLKWYEAKAIPKPEAKPTPKEIKSGYSDTAMDEEEVARYKALRMELLTSNAPVVKTSRPRF